MSSHSTNIQFKSVLHQVLKMTPSCSYTGGKSRTPLIYRFIYDVLSNDVPHTQQALTQLNDIIYAFLADPLLHYSPDLIMHGVHIWAVLGHWSGEIYHKVITKINVSLFYGPRCRLSVDVSNMCLCVCAVCDCHVAAKLMLNNVGT